VVLIVVNSETQIQMFNEMRNLKLKIYGLNCDPVLISSGALL